MMKRWFHAALLLAIAIIYAAAPSQALAYSYGDANTEDVAETYKLVDASLSMASPDWKAAEEAYKVRRSEISAHFGEDVAVTLDANIQSKDAKLVISNFKAVLVMNLERRFSYGIQGIDDYAATKLLLAKAKATFDTLAPYMSSKTTEISTAFDDALNALGNPGLFGVGKKAAQPEVFKEKVNGIYNIVNPLFPYKASAMPAVAEPAPTAKPAETPKTEPVATPGTGAGTSQPQPTAASSTSQPVASATPTPAATESAAPAPTASATASPTANPAETAAKSPEPTAGVTKPSTSNKELAAHAPMERTDKTNPWITFTVIGGVVLVGAGTVWFARKKKWI
jgi:hypothetical protein